MIPIVPLCQTCKLYKANDDPLACAAYKEIPHEIFFEAEKCKFYERITAAKEEE